MSAIHVEMHLSTKAMEHWTDSERCKLMERRKRRATFVEIGRELRRSERACRREFEHLKIEEAWRLEGAPVQPRPRGKFRLLPRRSALLRA